MMEKALGFVPAGATGIAEKRLRMELLAREGRSQEALDLGLELSNSLQDPAFLSLKAALADASKQPQLAADTLRQAIQLFPNREESYLDLSRLCSKYGDHKLAGEILDLGLRRIPDSFRLLVQKGITLETAGNRDQAKALFEKAAGAHPNQPVPAAALAVIQLLSEETSEAKATIFQALGRFPDDYYLHYLLGCVIEKEGTGAEGGEEWRVAVKAFETSVRLNPSFGPAHHSLGKLLARSAPEKAALHFESAIRQNPNALAAKYQLGRLYLELGRKEEGTRLLAEVEKRKAETLEREQSLSLPASRTQ
jgi:tetratricopeptide (TPR) repeat protein